MRRVISLRFSMISSYFVPGKFIFFFSRPCVPHWLCQSYELILCYNYIFSCFGRLKFVHDLIICSCDAYCYNSHFASWFIHTYLTYIAWEQLQNVVSVVSMSAVFAGTVLFTHLMVRRQDVRSVHHHHFRSDNYYHTELRGMAGVTSSCRFDVVTETQIHKKPSRSYSAVC